MTTKEIQQLLGEDEALLVFLAADKESYVFALTRYKFDWKVIALGTKALSEKIAAFRHGLDVNEINRAIQESRKAGLFDLGLANELYATLLGPVEPLVKDKKHLLIVPTGRSRRCRSISWLRRSQRFLCRTMFTPIGMRIGSSNGRPLACCRRW